MRKLRLKKEQLDDTDRWIDIMRDKAAEGSILDLAIENEQGESLFREACFVKELGESEKEVVFGLEVV